MEGGGKTVWYLRVGGSEDDPPWRIEAGMGCFGEREWLGGGNRVFYLRVGGTEDEE